MQMCTAIALNGTKYGKGAEGRHTRALSLRMTNHTKQSNEAISMHIWHVITPPDSICDSSNDVIYF